MSVEYCNSINAPKSLDVKLFQEVLENAILDTYVETKQIFFEMGSGGGDNYCSQIYRVRLTFQRDTEPLESVTVIVKSMPISDGNKFLEDMSVFLKEKIFYNNMLPRMEILLDKVKLGARLFYTHKEPINTLVFEDLSASGYVMADREKGLDLSHCKMVMRKLAQFHAVSMVIHKKDPKSMNAFRKGILDVKGVDSEIFQKLIGNNIQGLIQTISKWKGYESITEKVKKYAANLRENLINSQLPIAGELKVLNHGDLWVNNFLFKYHNGSRHQIDDVVFVDLQMSVFGSPGYDINYFLYTSVQLDVLKNKRDELLSIYHTTLCAELTAQKFKDLPSYDDILTEVRRREIYGFFANYAIFPAIAMDKSQSADNSLDNFMDDEFLKKKVEIMFQSKRLEETMRYTLNRFDKLGVLD